MSKEGQIRAPKSLLESMDPLNDTERQIVADNVGLARRGAWQVARMISGTSSGTHSHRAYQLFDELIGYAYIGLCVGVRRFDPSLGYQLSTYVKWWIRHYAQLAVRFSVVNIGAGTKYAENGKRVFALNPAANFSEVDMTDVVDHCGGDADSDFDDFIGLIRQCDGDPREEEVLRLRFLDGLSRPAIGSRLGLCGERVRQIESQALKQLKLKLKRGE